MPSSRMYLILIFVISTVHWGMCSTQYDKRELIMHVLLFTVLQSKMFLSVNFQKAVLTSSVSY